MASRSAVPTWLEVHSEEVPVYSMATDLIRTRRILALAAAITIGTVSAAGAAVTSYIAHLDGASESPPVASGGIGSAQVDVDPVAHTMRVRASFTGLTGLTTNSHIHGPTAVAGAGTAGVATTTPTFPGFPAGVTSGIYDNTFDMTLASSYNAAFIAANGGTPATAEAALFQAIADGKAYHNIHSSFASGGEIRGFLLPLEPTPTNPATWGRIKSLYR